MSRRPFAVHDRHGVVATYSTLDRAMTRMTATWQQGPRRLGLYGEGTYQRQRLWRLLANGELLECSMVPAGEDRWTWEAHHPPCRRAVLTRTSDRPAGP